MKVGEEIAALLLEHHIGAVPLARTAAQSPVRRLRHVLASALQASFAGLDGATLAVIASPMPPRAGSGAKPARLQTPRSRKSARTKRMTSDPGAKASSASGRSRSS